MARSLTMGDKVQITATSTTVPLANAQSIVFGNAVLAASGTATFTFTSPLIDQWTCPNVNVYQQNGDAGGPYTAALLSLTPATETFSANSPLSGAVITPGSITVKITNTVAVLGTKVPVITVELQ